MGRDTFAFRRKFCASKSISTPWENVSLVGKISASGERADCSGKPFIPVVSRVQISLPLLHEYQPVKWLVFFCALPDKFKNFREISDICTLLQTGSSIIAGLAVRSETVKRRLQSYVYTYGLVCDTFDKPLRWKVHNIDTQTVIEYAAVWKKKPTSLLKYLASRDKTDMDN